MTVRVWVPGIPAPQGSKRHIGGGRMVESSKQLRPWRRAVDAALRAGYDGPTLDGPVIVRLAFWLPRPASEPRTRRTLPVRRPDLDKLARAVLDSMTTSGAIRDDAVVVRLDLSERYVHPERLALPSEPTEPGVGIHANGLDQRWADFECDAFGSPVAQ